MAAPFTVHCLWICSRDTLPLLYDVKNMVVLVDFSSLLVDFRSLLVDFSSLLMDFNSDTYPVLLHQVNQVAAGHSDH